MDVAQLLKSYSAYTAVAVAVSMTRRRLSTLSSAVSLRDVAHLLGVPVRDNVRRSRGRGCIEVLPT
jgi:hypothetical protein